MKNIETDYTTQLRSDYLPLKKDTCDGRRRPFNPGDPNELLFIPAAQPATEENTMLFSASSLLPAIVY